MKKKTLFLLCMAFLLLPIVLAASNSLIVKIRSPESSYFNDTLNFSASVPAFIEAIPDKLTLNISTTDNISSGMIKVGTFSDNIEGSSGSEGLTAFTYFTIDASDNIENNLSQVMVKVYYSDAGNKEINNIKSIIFFM